MKRITWLLAGVVALGLSVPAMAGGDKHGEYAACEQSAEACLAYFSDKADNYGWVGIELDMDEESGVMTITRVVEESPAAKGGFKAGDVLFALNGVELSDDNKEALKEAKGKWAPGQEVAYTVKRENEDVMVDIVLAEVPKDVLAQWIGNHMLDSHMEVASAQ
jgi:C-terminal processing protease CtpA/Prc